LITSQISPEQTEKTRNKFNLWDKVLDKGLLEEEPETYWGFLSKDPTVFAYHFFKDDSGERLKLYPWQDIFINDDSQWKAAINARQVGKTTLEAVDLLHKAYFRPNQTLLCISSTKDQVKELIFKINRLLTDTHWFQFKTLLPRKNDSSRSVTLKSKGSGQSRIISVPATDAGRGYAANKVVLDELAFMENASYILNRVAIPTTTKTGGQVDILTTPNGQAGPAWDIYKGHEWNGWKVYNFNWTANPYVSPERISFLKGNMTWTQFSAEYEARFEAAQNAFFNQKTILAAVDAEAGKDSSPAGSVAVGVDFGKHMDYTVFYIGKLSDEDPTTQKVVVSDVIVKPLGTNYSDIIQELRDINERLHPIIFVVDATGVGETPSEMLELSGLPCEPVKLSLPKKFEIMNHLKILLEQGRIKIPENKELIDQLCLFEYRYQKDERMRLAAGMGADPTMKLGNPAGAHDDHVTALAFLAWGLKKFYAPASLTVIERANIPDKRKSSAPAGATLIFCDGCDKYHYDNCPVLLLNQSL